MVYQQQIDMDTWSYYIQAIAMNNKTDEALKQVNRLEGINGLQVTTDMYNCIVQGYLNQGRYQDAYSIWERMHVTPNLQLNNDSFVAILRYCSLTNQAERAFYVYVELKALDLTPDTRVFAALFRACAEAPQHINGYQDTIIEAMCLMEGAELQPTTEVYNNIIYAFSIPGDYISAEFYYWEMLRKGLLPDSNTYANLLLAYSRNCSVGLKSWGYPGRFIRKPEKLTEEQKMFRKIPPAKLGKMSKINVFG